MKGGAGGKPAKEARWGKRHRSAWQSGPTWPSTEGRVSRRHGPSFSPCEVEGSWAKTVVNGETQLWNWSPEAGELRSAESDLVCGEGKRLSLNFHQYSGGLCPDAMGMGQLWRLARVLGSGCFENPKLLTSAPHPSPIWPEPVLLSPSSPSGSSLTHQRVCQGPCGLSCADRTQLGLNKPSWVTVPLSALFAKGSRMEILLGVPA